MAPTGTSPGQLSASRREHGECRVRECFAEHEIAERYAANLHRALSASSNQLTRLGGRLREAAGRR